MHDFENLHNLIHLNDNSDIIAAFKHSNTNETKDCAICETNPDSDIQGNQSEICKCQLKGKFISKNVTNLFKRNLTVDEIFILSKGLNFVPTCNKILG